jgi:hypothetical protein
MARILATLAKLAAVTAGLALAEAAKPGTLKALIDRQPKKRELNVEVVPNTQNLKPNT